jgi:cellulase/cellobiase CelA1
MSRSRRRRGRLRPVPLAAVVAVVVAVATAVVLASQHAQGVTLHDAANSSAPLEASYQAGTGWGTGYDGQYMVTNAGTAAVTGWTLAFTLPAGTSVSSLWDGSYTDDSGQVTVKNDSWDATIQPGGRSRSGS